MISDEINTPVLMVLIEEYLVMFVMMEMIRRLEM